MLRLDDILKATGGKALSRGPEDFRAVSTDSRKINGGELFIALTGDNFDGNEFAASALEKASGAVISRAGSIPDGLFAKKSIVLVEDTLKALQDIARSVRAGRPRLPLVGITGSNGKTTTKELAAAVLGGKYRVLKSSGNLNNHIGLPLNLCGLGPEHEIAVLEMGASAPGDIDELCGIARPTMGVLTNVGFSHLEGFGSMEVLLRTKLELAQAVQSIIYNADDERLAPAIQSGFRNKALISFGVKARADVMASGVRLTERGSEFTLRIAEDGHADIKLGIPGAFNIYNSLAAAACGLFFDVGLEETAAALGAFGGVPMRYEIKEMAGATILSDIYNANPASMEEALKELVRLRKGRAVAVLGDMLELGGYSEDAHRRLGGWMASLPVDLFIAVGPMMGRAYAEFTKEGKEAIACKDSAQAAKALAGSLKKGDAVLIKGSRGMRMEKVLEEMK
ncbi:MAG: UDP-N-acetylmuramoyl-tripeptide--D-alanyl-D-alanine ligase [Nitrospiraceae bacterium]|nr:UDP-N-acetylmuramoyl-tripeptide--D-alanyl-D-alanine ligase [Nitrospiraceae bacterium]